VKRLGEIATTLDARRSTFQLAARRLMDGWRDEHSARFDREVIVVLDRHTSAILTAVRAADREVRRAQDALRAVGEDLRLR
jgi:hypothetical protein